MRRSRRCCYHTVEKGLQEGGWVLQRSKTHRVYERYVKQTFIRPSSPGTSNEHRALNLLKRNDTFINLHAYRKFISERATTSHHHINSTDELLKYSDISEYQDEDNKRNKSNPDKENDDAIKDPLFAFSYYQSVMDESKQLLLETKKKHKSEIRELLNDKEQLESLLDAEIKDLDIQLELKEKEIKKLTEENQRLKQELFQVSRPSSSYIIQ